MKLSFDRMLVATLAISLAAASARADFTDGLISYWPLDGNAEDAVRSNDGELVGTDLTAVYGAGQFGQGIDLDGIDQYLDVGNDPSLDQSTDSGRSGNITISTWFRVDSFDKGWQALVAKGEGSAWRIARRGGASDILAYAGGSGDIPTADDIGPNVNDGALHHVLAISEEGVSTRLWVDGELVATGGAPSTDRGNNPVWIGNNPNNAGRSWNGLIDDMAIWERPLTDDEIAEIWNGGTGNSIGSLIDGFAIVPGDVNGDQVVDLADYEVIRDNLGTPVSGGVNDLIAQGDLTGDGVVNIFDFGVWKDVAPAGVANSVNIPEPTSCGLALLGGLFAALRIRRRRSS